MGLSTLILFSIFNVTFKGLDTVVKYTVVSGQKKMTSFSQFILHGCWL